MATRTIHTGLYGTEAFHILDAVWTDVLDEYGCKRNTERTKSVIHTSVKQADDNEVVFELGSFYFGWNGNFPAFKGWSDKRVLDHLAWELKGKTVRFAQSCGDGKDVWKRSSSAAYLFSKRNTQHSYSVTVSKLYFIYDKLRGRKTEKRYPAEYATELVAMPLDPIMTEMKIAQKEEIKKLDDELLEKIRQLERERCSESEKARTAVCNKYNGIIEETKKEYAKKVKAIKKEMDSLGNAAALLLGK